MRAYHLTRLGDVDGLEVREHDVPSPGPNEVLVRMRAASLNYRDLLVLHGRFNRPLKDDVIPLSDGAGEVVAIGRDVTRWAVGDRVTSTYIPLWIDGRLTPELGREQWGSVNDGLLVEYRVMHEEKLVRIPDHLSFEEASTLPCAGLTAWSSLTGPRSVIAGDTVLTLGTGGVSLFALQLGKLFGARMIITTSSDGKAEQLRRLGADHVVNYRTTPDWDRAVMEVTGGRGVDHVVETTGAETLERSVRCAAVECQLALVGMLRLGASPAGINPAVLSGGITLRRIRVGSRTAHEAMIRAVELHRMRPLVDRTFPFEDVRAAYRYFEGTRQAMGKVVVSIG